MFDNQEVIASGLSVARLRLNVLASNIANAETTRTPEGGPYKRRDVVQMAVGLPTSFSSHIEGVSLARPAILAVVADQEQPRLVFRPGHPDADPNGMVAYPNINIVSTMTDLMTTSRLYQAGVTALETSRQMVSEAQRISVRT
jgi:flagellar basal-body rod protein FlgC